MKLKQNKHQQALTPPAQPNSFKWACFVLGCFEAKGSAGMQLETVALSQGQQSHCWHPVRSDMGLIVFFFFSRQAYLWALCWSSEPHSDFIFLQEGGKQTALFLFGWCWVFLMLQKIRSVLFLVTNVQTSYLPVLTQINQIAVGSVGYLLRHPNFLLVPFLTTLDIHCWCFPLLPYCLIFGSQTHSPLLCLLFMILGACIAEAACFAWLSLKNFVSFLSFQWPKACC